jgi:hypothetical protein
LFNLKKGRASNSDTRITDISVSRFHSILRFAKGEFHIDDDNSKFGTLILIRAKLSIDYNFLNKVTLQINRTALTFFLKNKPENILDGCCRLFYSFLFLSLKKKRK